MDLEEMIKRYLGNCEFMRGLSFRTLKAYKTDMDQFRKFAEGEDWCSKQTQELYIRYLYSAFKPKTARRKIACLKSFFSFLEEDFDFENPYHKLRIKHKEPLTLPRTIPAHTLQLLLQTFRIV